MGFPSDASAVTPNPCIGWKIKRFKEVRNALLLALLASVASASPKFDENAHTIFVTPGVVDFGALPLETSEHRGVTIRNDGARVLTIRGAEVRGSHNFALVGWKGHIALQPSQSLQLGVVFTPKRPNRYSATLVLAFDEVRRHSVRLEGRGLVSTPEHISVLPSTVVLPAGRSQQFYAAILSTTRTPITTSSRRIKWLVNGLEGGDPRVGTISPGGLYRAPSDVSSGSSVVITAASEGGKGSAKVTFLPAPTLVSVSISPASSRVPAGGSQQFTAQVSGTTNTAVVWSLGGADCTGGACGMISAGGQYSAPAKIPSSGTVRIVATSVADPTKSASAVIAIAALAVTLHINPSAVTVPTAGMQSFTASIGGTSNTQIVWTVRGSGCSGSSCGTLASSALSAVYSAPTVAPSPASISVIATSVADGTKSAGASVTITPVIAVSVAPANFSLPVSATQQFTASVTGTPNEAVTWSVSGQGCSGVTCGTVDGRGVYLAPGQAPTPNNVTVTATSAADRTKSASAAVTIKMTSTVTVAVQPNGSTVAPYSPLRLLPRARKRLYANVCNGSNTLDCERPSDIGVTWRASCGGLSATTGPYVDYTAPSSGGPCTITAINSASGATGLATATLASPTVSIDVMPAALTLYRDQYALLQAVVTGSVNRDVTWSLTSNPGNAGTLTSQGWTATFSAGAPGAYIATATSAADGTKYALITLYVTANMMPATATANHTEPVDCTAVGSGTTYDVGPTQRNKTINSVPWQALRAGDTVRIHNEGPDGSPTTYHEKWLIKQSGTASQPIRVCGVPNGGGELPVIDGNNAADSTSYAYGIIEDRAPIIIYDRSAAWGNSQTYPKYITIEGLKITNELSSLNFINQSGILQSWGTFGGAIWIQHGGYITIRGMDLEGNQEGLFDNAQSPESAMSRWLLVEGNYVARNGIAGNFGSHQMYLQAFGQVVQGNYLDEPLSGMLGSQLKERCVACFTRYNYASAVVAGQRVFDVVAPEESSCLNLLQQHYYQGAAFCGNSPDSVAATEDWFGTDYVYGNIVKFSQSARPVHYGDDNCAEYAHGGTLYFYNNTIWEAGDVNYRWTLFDTGPGGAACRQVTPINAYPGARFTNNAIKLSVPTDSSSPFFYWSDLYSGFLQLDTNWISNSWGNGTGQGSDGDGTAFSGTTASAYQTGNDAHHITGIENLITGTGTPFDTVDFAPTEGSPLVGVARPLPAGLGSGVPVTMQYNPHTYLMTPRVSATDIGARSAE